MAPNRCPLHLLTIGKPHPFNPIPLRQKNLLYLNPQLTSKKKSVLLHAPTPRPGFRITHHWYPDIQLAAPEVWHWLFMFQSMLAAHDAQQPVPHFLRFTSADFSAAIGVTVANPQLTFGDTVWGLYEAGVLMSRRDAPVLLMPDRMPGLGIRVQMPLLGTVGFIKIEPRSLLWGGVPPTATKNNNNDATRKRPAVTTERLRGREEVGASNESAVVALDSGDVRSSEDEYLVVHYNFDRYELAPARMLTAFLRTMTFCSEHDDGELGASMVAFSADGYVRLSMDGVQAGPGARQLSWRKARLALRTMWPQVVMGFGGRYPESPRWEAFSFVVEYQGVRIGQGWIG